MKRTEKETWKFRDSDDNSGLQSSAWCLLFVLLDCVGDEIQYAGVKKTSFSCLEKNQAMILHNWMDKKSLPLKLGMTIM